MIFSVFISKNRSVDEVAERLLSYHKSHYSANLMSIAILTKSSDLKALENSIIENLLSMVMNYQYFEIIEDFFETGLKKHNVSTWINDF
jgi:secreted Zn-dependent insulinase-like peptidase